MTKIVERIEQTEVVMESAFGSELHTAIEEKLRSQSLPAIKRVVESFVREELSAHISARKSEGLPASDLYRSGSFSRGLTTLYGYIEDLSVPKLRKGNKDREWQVLKKHSGLMPLLVSKLIFLYVLGLSLRDLQESLYVLMNKMLSKRAINRVTLELQSQLSDKMQSPIVETPSVLIVDGVWVKMCIPTGETYLDKSGHERKQVKVQERVILAAIGVRKDGSYGLVHYRAAEIEDEENWNTFFEAMIGRGLDAELVEMVVADGSKGILSSTNKNFKNASLQRCIQHKSDNISLYLSYKGLEDKHEDFEILPDDTKGEKKRKYRNGIIGQAKNIFLAPDLEEAKTRLEAWVKKWTETEEKAVSVFNKGIDRCFEFYSFDAGLHKLIRTTNLIERSFREFRTKADEIGAFPNELGCMTLFIVTINRFHVKNNKNWKPFAKT